MVRRIIMTYGIGVMSGLIFYLLSLPLPWILGPVTGLLLTKWGTNFTLAHSVRARDLAFGILGIQIGLTFTSETFSIVGPYFLPYTTLSLIMILSSLGLAYLLSTFINIDAKTSMIGSAPGGLSAMISVSESLHGNTVLVTILHTIRLLTVLFFIPFLVTHWVAGGDQTTFASNQSETGGSFFTVVIYVLSYVLGYLLQHRLPAALVIVPMLIVGGLQALGIALFTPPLFLFLLAQLMIGVHLGQSIQTDDIKKAGRYCFYYLGLSVAVIALGFGGAWVLVEWTGMSFVTAVLSLAPGGLVEMALTAKDAGGNPSIVSSLQIIRLLTIVIVLPIFLKWLLPKIQT